MSRPSRPSPSPPGPSFERKKFVDQRALERVLAPLVEDEQDLAFIARCIAGEGPPHHQGANYALLRLVAAVVERVGACPAPQGGARPSMRVPPHHVRPDDEREFAIALPPSAVRRIEPDPKKAEALEECLLDGPTHHALANVAMAALLDAVLAKLDEGEPR